MNCEGPRNNNITIVIEKVAVGPAMRPHNNIINVHAVSYSSTQDSNDFLFRSQEEY